MAQTLIDWLPVSRRQMHIMRPEETETRAGFGFSKQRVPAQGWMVAETDGSQDRGAHRAQIGTEGRGSCSVLTTHESDTACKRWLCSPSKKKAKLNPYHTHMQTESCPAERSVRCTALLSVSPMSCGLSRSCPLTHRGNPLLSPWERSPDRATLGAGVIQGPHTLS